MKSGVNSQATPPTHTQFRKKLSGFEIGSPVCSPLECWDYSGTPPQLARNFWLITYLFSAPNWINYPVQQFPFCSSLAWIPEIHEIEGLFLLACFIVVVVFFKIRSLLCSSGCPVIHCVDQASLELRRFTCFFLWSTGIKGACYHSQFLALLKFFILRQSF